MHGRKQANSEQPIDELRQRNSLILRSLLEFTRQVIIDAYSGLYNVLIA